MGIRQVLYSSDDYSDLGDFAERYLRDYGETPGDEEARELLAAERQDDLAYLVRDVDAALAGDNPGGCLVAREPAGKASGFSAPYPSFSALVGDTEEGGLFEECDAFDVYVEDGSLFMEGARLGARMRVEVRALAPHQVSPFFDAAWRLAAGDPAPLERLWRAAARIGILQGGIVVR